MAGEIIYADLRHPGGASSAAERHRAPAVCPRWHGILLKVGGLGHLVLLVLVAVLSVQVTQKALTPLSAPWNGSEAGGRNRTELCMISSLLRYFCRSSRNSSAARAGCQLCPQSWQLLGDRCYRLSEEEGTWMQGKKDCEDQESHLAVLRNKTEEEYVNRFTVSGKRPVWIGLMASEKTWRWVDNSSLSTTALRKVDKGCGTFKHMKLEADGCEGEHKWVCQKEAFHFFPKTAGDGEECGTSR